MNQHFNNITLEATGAKSLHEKEEIQSLWSGYGSIVRLTLKGVEIPSVVAKHVRMPNQNNHPRGWNTDFSHARKVRSYEVETAWYQKYAKLCNENCKVPSCYVIESDTNEVFMVLEDLDSIGYASRLSSVTWNNIEVCLKWLANFHATFLHKKPERLWEMGTYWHLATRPDELDALDDTLLKKAAPAIDRKLNTAKYLTFVHGDAKLANFCFSADGNDVAAVDFQYVGGGCGMKDVAYFIGSCLYEDDCERYEERVLSKYFRELKLTLEIKNIDIDFKGLEKEWRELYPYAWADFHRFLKGWSSGHWKINSYSERLCKKVIEECVIATGKL